MSRRVSKLAVGLLVVSLSFNVPVYAAATRDGGWTPRDAYARIVSSIKKLVKPLASMLNEDNKGNYPLPPIP
jgi:hypothetical protein